MVVLSVDSDQVWRICALCRHLEVIESGQDIPGLLDSEYNIYRCAKLNITSRENYLLLPVEPELSKPKPVVCPYWEAWQMPEEIIEVNSEPGDLDLWSQMTGRAGPVYDEPSPRLGPGEEQASRDDDSSQRPLTSQSIENALREILNAEEES